MTTYRAARVHTGSRRGPSRTLSVQDGRIVPRAVAGDDDDRFDLGDVEIVPGLVDLHADSLIRFEQPRRGVVVPMAHALRAFADDALLAGVTTAFLCCSLENGTTVERSAEHAEAVLDTLASLLLPIDVRVHLRVDLTHDDPVDALRRFLTHPRHRPLIGLVSSMTHLPGSGQYPDESSWRSAFRVQDMIDDRVLDGRLRSMRSGARGIEVRRAVVASMVLASGLPLAAHDDDAASVRIGIALGATISEFPVQHGAAATAHRAGLGVVVGAPNLWRGGSHGSGPSARQALRTGTADIVASDYHLGAMIPGLRAAEEDGVRSFPELLAAVTRTPAVRVGLEDRGHLEPGSRADFIALDDDRVVGVWVAGAQRLQC